MKYTIHLFSWSLFLMFSSHPHAWAATGAEKLEFRGFKECYRLFNDTADVIVVPESGGRILAYRLGDKNVLYTDPKLDGKSLSSTKDWFDPDAGRFDIGPETGAIPPRTHMWLGGWQAEITGKRELTLTSVAEESVGLVVTRVFKLDKKSSYLQVQQTMRNISSKEVRYCFWSRTLAPAGGIAFLPINPKSKFAKGWVTYPLTGENMTSPQDPRITLEKGYFLFRPSGKSAKYGLDSFAGWLGYFREGVVFAKRFACFPEGKYVDGAGFSVEFYGNDAMCELEPLSPEAVLKPGSSYRFDEHWWLLPWPEGKLDGFDVAAAARLIEEQTKLPR